VIHSEIVAEYGAAVVAIGCVAVSALASMTTMMVVAMAAAGMSPWRGLVSQERDESGGRCGGG
jgi:hypothetical protein